MRRGQEEVVIGGEQRQLVTNAQLRKHGVDRADLQAGATTAISQLRGIDVILPVWGQKRQGREPINDVFACPRAGESLQQFLQDEPRGYDAVAAFEGVAQRACLWRGGGSVAPEGKRPDASIDEQVH